MAVMTFMAAAASRLYGASRRTMRYLCFGVCVILLAACSGKVDVLTNVTESVGNEVLVALLDAGVDAGKINTKDGVTIQVHSDQVAYALDALNALGLPRERYDGMGQIFRKEGLVSSPLEERARYIYALSQELANTLSQVDGVVTARVHVVLPERGGIGESTTPSTAAVFIKHRPDYNLDALQPQFRQLITHSIPGLSSDRVSVVFVPAQPAADRLSARSDNERVVPGLAGWLAPIVSALILVLIVAAAGFWLMWRRRKRVPDAQEAA
ncbi:MAG: type III secretion inner membrane ring lipoprotein SctJ [Candidimonas sp.]|jgi:type III secretion protein J